MFKSRGITADHLQVLRNFFIKIKNSGMTIKLSKTVSHIFIISIEAPLRDLEKRHNKGTVNVQQEMKDYKYITIFEKIKTMIEFAYPLLHI